MHHINDDGEAKKCNASSPENCRFYKGEEVATHYEDEREAQAASQAILAQRHGALPKATRYSFLKAFKEKEREFNEEFDGFPTRFFNADLAGKYSVNPDSITSEREAFLASRKAGVYRRELAHRLAQFSSSPKDGEIPSEQVEATAAKLGISDVQEVHDKKALQGFKTDRLWTGRTASGGAVIITGASSASKNFQRYRFTYAAPEPFKRGSTFTQLDVRTMVGASRVEDKTGIPVASVALGQKDVEGLTQEEQLSLNGAALVVALKKMQDLQEKGSNFKSQKKHFSEQRSAATAWMDKKNQSKEHQEMAKNSPLSKHFSKIEIDADVDAESFHDFEAAYEEVKDKLPPIPGDRAPELRIRKLGRHNANGIYFPHSNTIAIDVNTSGAFVHEYAHYVDIAVRENASLSDGFRGIARDYRKGLELPPGMSDSKREYYSNASEVLARGYELYSSERLGINNRLLDISKLDNFDYAPFRSNPELKERLFTFFDGMHAASK